MCIFTTRVDAVSGTRIFVRRDGGEQLLAYQMSFEAAGKTAMVLPLPVSTTGREEAVRFIDLDGYPYMFAQLDRLFPIEQSDDPVCTPGRSSTLAVHDVGLFEASYVPTVEDFARLDRRFRIPSAVLGAVPAYRDWGFAVFKLKPPGGLLAKIGIGRRAARPHPMAFAFRTRFDHRLFFPTVHAHDGVVHPRAPFDHRLYCQLSGSQRPSGPLEWERSAEPAGDDRTRTSGGMVAAELPVHRARIVGEHPNEDVYVDGTER
jgi:hypothetical protein